MQYGRVDGIDKDISRLAQGTMMLQQKEMEKGFELLDAVFELGCNAFDCGHIYGGGGCERVFGQWIEKRGLREKVVILDKGCHNNADRKRVTPFDIASDLHDSLARLRTDYIDLYVLHRDDPSVEVGPIVEALNEHLRAGKIRAFGGSNWSHTRIAEANAYAGEQGLVPFVASSPQFSLVEQVDEPWPGCISIGGPGNAAAQAWYQDNQMAIFAWSSLAGGFLSGALTRESDGGLPEEAAARARRAYGTEANYARLDRARKLAADHGVTVPQVALAYAFSQPLNLFTIAGGESREEIAANATALALHLPDASLAWLDTGKGTL